MGYEIEYYYVSHKGKLRTTNQDNFYCLGQFMDAENEGTKQIVKGTAQPSEKTVFGVFDGMGGEEKGEIAAFLAASEMKKASFLAEAENALRNYCVQTNRVICDYTSEHNLYSMGTTMAVLLFQPKSIFLCNIGDSKIYLYSDNELQQISYDHVSVSVAGRKPPLTQNLGIPESVLTLQPYYAEGAYHNKDVYLICSDGLSDMVSEDAIKDLLDIGPPEEAAEALLRRALDNGGKDNITFILLYVKRKKLFGK